MQDKRCAVVLDPANHEPSHVGIADAKKDIELERIERDLEAIFGDDDDDFQSDFQSLHVC